jgi:anti-sigma B factor antagonist
VGEPSTREIQDGALTLRASEDDSICTLALAGELDMSNAPAFSGELQRLEASGTALRIDLSELEFIDSTGIAILVGVHHRLGDRLSLVRSPAQAVERVLSVTGLDQGLPFE